MNTLPKSRTFLLGQSVYLESLCIISLKLLRKNSPSFRSPFSQHNNSTATYGRINYHLCYWIPAGFFVPVVENRDKVCSCFGLLRSGTRAAVNLPLVTLLDTYHISWDVQNSVETSFKTPVFHTWLSCLCTTADVLICFCPTVCIEFVESKEFD